MTIEDVIGQTIINTTTSNPKNTLFGAQIEIGVVQVLEVNRTNA